MRGAVAAGHPLTAEAGARVLAEGGNAVDACIGAAFVAWVTESPLTGPGAGGFMLVHRARDANDFLLDFFVEVPGRGTGTPSPMEEATFHSAAETRPSDSWSARRPARFRDGRRSCGGAPSLRDDALGRAGRAQAARARAGVELTEQQALLHEVLDAVLRHDADGRRMYGTDERLCAGKGWSWRSGRYAGSPGGGRRSGLLRRRARGPHLG